MSDSSLSTKILLFFIVVGILAGIAFLILYILNKNKNTNQSFPDNVIIVHPTDDMINIQSQLDTIYQTMGGSTPAWNGQFSDKRWAIMFMPGTYPLYIRIGYYTSIYGLGKSPADVIITGTVMIENGSPDKEEGGLNNFWRSCENITISPSGNQTTKQTQFAVSQASPLRKLNIDGDLFLFQIPSDGGAAFTSGGYLSDSTVSGTISSGSQQQFMTRNTSFSKWQDSVWNQVFSGCPNAPPTKCCPNKSIPFEAFTNTGPVEKICEKPYISSDDSKSYFLNIPKPELNKNGPTTNFDNVTKVPFSKVFIAKDTDTVDTINSNISNNMHIIFSPGIYNLDKSIIVNQPNITLLGLGMATLISSKGMPCIIVNNFNGIRIAGLLLQAGPQKSSSLLQWGTSNFTGDPSNPGVISDVFGRVGGPDNQPVSTGSMFEINHSEVIIDNTWLWVADHGVKVGYGVNSCDYGLIVNSDNVTAYGLMSEHNDKDNVLWKGENGKVFFYQSEFRYDFPNQAAFGDNVSYRVADNVTTHTAYGLGAYCFFPGIPITIANGFKIPSTNNTKISMNNLVTVFLKGSGEITHVINGVGNTVNKIASPNTSQQSGQLAYVCKYPNNPVICT